MHRRVNRFTFDTHSVVLFSALVLSSAVAVASPVSSSNSSINAQVASSVASHTAPAGVGPKTLTSSVARNGNKAGEAGH